MPAVFRISYENKRHKNVESKVAKAAIFNFDFVHDNFEELNCGYIADSEFRST